MGTFSDFVSSNNLDATALQRLSSRLEARSSDDQALLVKRAAKRRTAKDKTYEESGLAKPKSGRPFSTNHWGNALKDRPIPARVRSKMLKAINASLTKQGKEAVDMKTVFGEVPAVKGEAPAKKR
ncbi:MAG TPA: hypothetical protein VK013_09290 [Myxococcaceae bacterium]|nr:hypothetical protein [Myxococcaceae bacterium]